MEPFDTIMDNLIIMRDEDFLKNPIIIKKIENLKFHELYFVIKNFMREYYDGHVCVVRNIVNNKWRYNIEMHNNKVYNCKCPYYYATYSCDYNEFDKKYVMRYLAGKPVITKIIESIIDKEVK